MALPPKSDDTTSSASAAGESKKARKPAAPRKPKAEKAEKPAKAPKAKPAKADKPVKASRGEKAEKAATPEFRFEAPAPAPAQAPEPRAEQPRAEPPRAAEAPAAPYRWSAEPNEAPAPERGADREERGNRDNRGGSNNQSNGGGSSERGNAGGDDGADRRVSSDDDQGSRADRPERSEFRPSSQQGGQGGGSDASVSNSSDAKAGGDRQDQGGSNQQSGGSDAPSAQSDGQAPQQGGGQGGQGGQGGGNGGGGGQPQQQPKHGQQGGGQQGGGQREWQDRGQQGGGGGQHNQGGGQGGQGRDRDFWKQGKRKRGRHGGGPWQPGGPGPGGGNQGGGGGHQGGGGGGHGGHGAHGGREQHPPQPPPPSNTPVFGDLPNPSRFNDLAALDTLSTEISGASGDVLWLNELYALTLFELTAFARKYGVTFEGAPHRRQLINLIFGVAAAQKRPVKDRGYIDVTDRGAFVVHEHVNYRLYPEDAYLPESLIKRYGLKRGHKLEVVIQPPQTGERCPSVVGITSVMGGDPNVIANVTPFEELVPYYPLKRILLESEEIHPKDVSMRAVDILTPIGFGQRGLIVAPPRTGKTVLLQNIANSITANSPEVKLILLLIDERPEEVTDFKRHTKGEVVSSTFDETPESHIHCAEMVIEICRRRVEQGEHVVILLDSITRLARAYNAMSGSGGKTMSGGLESNALQKPKRFFGSARNIEGGGSLTIIASALIDTGSRMDEIIFEEFKGTGNSELHLDRGLVERRIFPAINIDRSGTRKEELIYHPEELQRIYGLRRAMQGLGPIESMEMLITRLKKTKSNAEFLMSLARQ